MSATRAIIGKTILELVTGDIADQDTDAVVTAAHWKLHGGDGTDGAIQRLWRNAGASADAQSAVQ
jgi:O-acetyl-ADP-ribose deacetylase (regulator of RNase III)